jgi:hypothetical protein
MSVSVTLRVYFIVLNWNNRDHFSIRVKSSTLPSIKIVISVSIWCFMRRGDNTTLSNLIFKFHSRYQQDKRLSLLVNYFMRENRVRIQRISFNECQYLLLLKTQSLGLQPFFQLHCLDLLYFYFLQNTSSKTISNG